MSYVVIKVGERNLKTMSSPGSFSMGWIVGGVTERGELWLYSVARFSPPLWDDNMTSGPR